MLLYLYKYASHLKISVLFHHPIKNTMKIFFIIIKWDNYYYISKQNFMRFLWQTAILKPPPLDLSLSYDPDSQLVLWLHPQNNQTSCTFGHMCHIGDKINQFRFNRLIQSTGTGFSLPPPCIKGYLNKLYYLICILWRCIQGHVPLFLITELSEGEIKRKSKG